MMQGIEECSICYCILHTNNELPKRTCRTCKKKFHDACLVRKIEIFKISNVSFFFSFVGFDHPINLHVPIVERTFKFLFCLFLTSIICFFDINVLYGIYFHMKRKRKQIFFSYRLFMPTDKAKESAAIAVVDEQINSVGRK
jgi:hypothetical protein